ncbi:multidrug resistance protein mrp-7-like [Haemaphysalis longicornis]
MRILLGTVAYFACVFARIPALEYTVNACGNDNMRAASLLLALTCTGEFLVSVYNIDLAQVMVCRARSMLQGVIYHKVTKMAPRTRNLYPAGRIASLLGVDCTLLCNVPYAVALPFVGALTLPFILWMLALRVGAIPALCCAAWMLLVLSLPLIVARPQKRLWKQAMAVRDERLKATSDLLSTIRVVKMYAWENAMQQNVVRSRAEELKWLLRLNLLDAVLDSVYSASSSVLIIILFSAMAYLEPDITLSPALSFSCVSLIYMTDLTTNGIGIALRCGSQAVVSLKRIAEFCSLEEDQHRGKTCTLPAKIGAVRMENCWFSWSKRSSNISDAELQNVSLNIEAGSLVGIVGFVGSGKSSLLSAILGDMERLKGNLTCTGRIAYVPQLPIVHNMTIRDNILFGKPMHTGAYNYVLSSCQLMNDLNKFQHGDMTEVGEKGSNLSGGQKQRISMARAVYSQSDVYLLDDPLSALDPVVGSKLFAEVLGNQGLLKQKTRILVCNQANYLHAMDKLILVHGKRIKVYKNLEDLIRDPEAPKNLTEAFHSDHLENPTGSSSHNDELADDDVIGRITEEEQGVSTKTAWQLACCLLRLARWPAPFALISFAVAAGALGWQLVWIKDWTDAAGSPEYGQPKWVEVLLGLCFLDVFCRVAGAVLLALAAQKTSRSLHDQMLAGVLWSPVSFFDACPRGRILNRFSADMDAVDSRGFLSGKQAVQNSLLTLAKVAVIGSQSPVVVGITAVVVACAAFGLNLAVQVANWSRFAEGLAVSRLLQHVTETVDALSSLRAFGVVRRFQRHFYCLTDATMRGYSLFAMCFTMARLLASGAAFLVVIATLVANTTFAPSGEANPSGLGLALSAAISVPISLMSLCVTLFVVLQTVVGAERCLEYTELVPEKDVADTWTEQKRTEVMITLSGWPSEGKVEFQNYSASYRPGDLPNVLSDLTFLVKPMEKVGVVGRTGAGKSSLVLALLRILQASQGRILIDDTNIADVPLQKLRRGITVIPQDPSLVRGTLRMNLDPSNSHSDEEIWLALEKAHLAKMVSDHPDKLLLITADGGSNLSVGQRQLVCLARALLRDTRILLLDEATSQMDGDTDQLIQATLRDSFSQCTLLTIAHRLHTVLDYDRILVLDDGRVREFDSPERLLSDTSSTFFAMAVDAGIRSILQQQAPVNTRL